MRKWLSITSVIIIFLLIIVIAGVWQFQRILKSAGITDLRYQIETFSARRLYLTELSFIYDSPNTALDVEVRNLRVDWSWANLSPQLNAVDIEQLKLKRLAPSMQKIIEEDSPDFKLPDDWRIPKTTPKKIQITKFIFEQPCGSGVCQIAAQATLLAPSPENVNLKLIASPGTQVNFQHQHQLQLMADYTVKNNLPDLNIKLWLDQDIQLQINTSLEHNTETDWFGAVTGSVKYPDAWWLSQLQLWGLKDLNVPRHPVSTAALDIETNWQVALKPLLKLQAENDIHQFAKALHGRWLFVAKIPQDFQVPGLGRFSGTTKIDVDIDRGQLKGYTLLADVLAQELTVPDVLKGYGLEFNQARINVQSQEERNASMAAMPVMFSADVQGALAGNLSGHVLLDLFTKKIIADRLSLKVKSNRLNPYNDVELKNFNLDLQAVGYWQPESFSFNQVKPIKVSADLNSKSLNLSAKSARLLANKLQVSGVYDEGSLVVPKLVVESEGTIDIEKLSHDQLKPHAWRWRGKTRGTLGNLDVRGDLTVGQALTLNHHVTTSSSKLNAEWKLADIFLIAANPFADTLKAWPSLLSLVRGKLSAQGKLEYSIEKNILEKSETNLQLGDVAGIYDTAAFEGLNGKAVITTAKKAFKVVNDDLRLNQVNKGFLLGPLTARATYQATWQKPLEGRLALKHFNVMVAQGNVSTTAQNFDLSKSSQQFTVNLKQVNLTNILQQYPTSDLTGTGQLSGSIPVEVTKKGVRVNKGRVAAEEPGGKLKYQSARANELAKSQPSMKLLTEALSDFQYSVLSSDVNYDESGKLMLSVRLEGQNPKLEKGRPIHFNINFEEDIPAMLASIQLSSKVNDIIKKRLQEYLQRKPASDGVSIKN